YRQPTWEARYRLHRHRRRARWRPPVALRVTAGERAAPGIAWGDVAFTDRQPRSGSVRSMTWRSFPLADLAVPALGGAHGDSSLRVVHIPPAGLEAGRGGRTGSSSVISSAARCSGL